MKCILFLREEEEEAEKLFLPFFHSFFQTVMTHKNTKIRKNLINRKYSFPSCL